MKFYQEILPWARMLPTRQTNPRWLRSRSHWRPILWVTSPRIQRNHGRLCKTSADQTSLKASLRKASHWSNAPRPCNRVYRGDERRKRSINCRHFWNRRSCWSSKVLRWTIWENNTWTKWTTFLSLNANWKRGDEDRLLRNRGKSSQESLFQTLR